MKQAIGRIGLVPAMIFVSAAAACTTSAPGNADGLRRVVGTDLIGARGATPADQRKIDRTIVGICAADIWTSKECSRHNDGAVE